MSHYEQGDELLPIIKVFDKMRHDNHVTGQKKRYERSYVTGYNDAIKYVRRLILKGFKCPDCKTLDKPKCIEIIPLLQKLEEKK
jgi:hypothetical protein